MVAATSSSNLFVNASTLPGSMDSPAAAKCPPSQQVFTAGGTAHKLKPLLALPLTMFRNVSTTVGR